MTGSVAILGAGAMGSALATPLRRRGWDVRLWGTWLDDDLVAACRAGQPHPRTQVALAAGTEVFDAGQLRQALRGATMAVLAVTAAGVEEVTRRAGAALGQVETLLLVSKGFATDPDGRVELLPDRVRAVLHAAGVAAPPIVAIGGPCKANEVAAERPTATVFGAADGRVAEAAAAAVRTDSYRPEAVADEAGVEICAPMKNVYAIALGAASGLAERGGQPWHDLQAAVFTQAVRELALLTDLVGGRPSTPIGLAGVGDLEVTGLSGRNKLYGVRIGRGEPPGDAMAAMAAAGQTVEGVPSCQLAVTLVDQRGAHLWSRLPLLGAVASLLAGAARPDQILAGAALPAA